jgi:hypothetical protein
MKVLLQLAVCSTLLVGGAVAQHRGGGGGGGSRGSSGGFSRGGGGVSSGFRGSFGGGVSSGFRGGGVVSNGFRGGVFNNGFRGGVFNNGFRGGFGYGYGWPYYGFGFGLGYGYSPYYGYGDYYDSPYSYSYPDAYSSYPAYQSQAYQSSPNVTVVYPQTQQSAPVYADRAAPVMREYDQYGQQLRTQAAGSASSSPIYLIALKNHNIYAASSYSVNGDTLHYVTLEHAEKQVALSDIDRDMTMRLNGERRVQFQLPAQQ